MNKKIDVKEIALLLGIILVVFSIMILLTNPLNFEAFPAKINATNWIGIALLVIGIIGVYYGAK